MENSKTDKSVSHLKRREIQAPLVSALIKGFSKEIGKEKAESVAKSIICEDAVLSGKTLAQSYGGNSLKELLKVAQEVWAGDGIMQLENIQMESDHLSFDVTRCGYAEMYERLGTKELGTLLSCCRDFAFMDGFNPDLELVRTKTIMEGHDCCDFRYRPRK